MRNRVGGSRAGVLAETSLCRWLPIGLESSLRTLRFENLDRIARRVVHNRLIAADADDDVATDMGACLAEAVDYLGDARHLDREAIPATRRRHRTVGHLTATARAAARLAQHQPQVAPREHRERWRRMHVFVEAK